MTKTTARILALICTLGTLFLVFQVRFISPEEGKHVMVYAVPGSSIGASAGEDLRAQLQEKYGEETENADLGPVKSRDQNARIVESLQYELDDLGQDFGGTRYVLCDVVTTRTLVGENGDPLDQQIMTVSYLSMDGSPEDQERIRILWDTAQVNYSGKQSEFDALAGNKR